MFQPQELIRRLQPIIGNRANDIWNYYLISDDEERRIIQHSLENLHNQLVDDYKHNKVVLPPPNQWEHLQGDYPIGMVMYPDDTAQYPFYLQEKELRQHLSVFGRTGSGKSFFTKGMLLTQVKRNIPFLLLDWKGTYKDILSHQVILFEPGSKTSQFRFNPLDLDGIDKEYHQTYIRQVIELLLESYFDDLRLLTVKGVESLLLRAVDELSVKQGAITFTNIYNWVEAFEGKFREMDWKTSALNILYKINTGPLGNVMQGASFKIDWLSQQKTIFELHNIGNSEDKSFFIKTLLLRLYYHFRQQGPADALKLLIVIEEAHNILLKRGGYETILDLMLRECREFGVAFMILDQHPSTLSLSALGSYCIISFNLKLRQDREAMASALNLEQQEVLGRLPSRYAVIKLSDRYLQPFLIRTFDLPKQNRFSISKGMKMEKLPTSQQRHHNKPIKGFEGLLRVVTGDQKQAHRVVSDFTDLKPVLDGIGGVEGSEAVVRACEAVQRMGKWMIWEEIFLCHIYAYPLMPAMGRYKSLGISSYHGNKYKKLLAKRDFIQVQEVSTSKGRIKLMVPTQQGFDWLKNRGFGSGRSDTDGGMMHKYWIRRLRDQFERMRFSTDVEAHIGNQNRVDLQISKDGQEIGIEVETGRNDGLRVIGNIDKCVRHFGAVVVFMINPNRYKKLKERCKDKRVAIVTDEAMCIFSVLKFMGDAA